MQARDLQGCLVGLGAGVAQEGALHAGQCTEPLAELLLQRDAVHVGGVQQGRRLVAQRLRHVRVGVTETGHRDAAQRVEVALAIAVPQPGAFAARERDRQPVVGGHKCVAHAVTSQK
jgi:hypothetical protein